MADPAANPDPAAALAAALERLLDAAREGQPEGLDAKGAARFLGISVSKLRELDHRGLMPAAAMLGDGLCKRWPRRVLAAWLVAGAPSRARWELMKDQVLRRVG